MREIKCVCAHRSVMSRAFIREIVCVHRSVVS